MELVAPSLDPRQAERMLYSVSLGTVLPDVVTLVSNEIFDLDTSGLNVRVLSFRSDAYPIGYRDVALRCNIGLFFAQEELVMQCGEDHIASYNTIEEGAKLLESRNFYWGHHRYIPLTSVHDTVFYPAEFGRSREHGVNRNHTFRSCYSGSFGYRKSYLTSIGGWDMAFMCRHAGEDQQLGKRLSSDGQAFIHEPPFWWHPDEADGWGKPVYTNVCGDHDYYLDGKVRRCYNCPFFDWAGTEPQLFDVTSDPIIRFDPSKVDIAVKWL